MNAKPLGIYVPPHAPSQYVLRIHGTCRHKLQYLLHTDGICSRVRFSFVKNAGVARTRVLTATITELEAKHMILRNHLQNSAKPIILTKTLTETIANQ